jgi:hypothetical protein
LQNILAVYAAVKFCSFSRFVNKNFYGLFVSSEDAKALRGCIFIARGVAAAPREIKTLYKKIPEE